MTATTTTDTALHGNGRTDVTAPPEPAPVPPLVEPRQHDWDETPAEAAAWDRRHFDRDED